MVVEVDSERVVRGMAPRGGRIAAPIGRGGRGPPINPAIAPPTGRISLSPQPLRSKPSSSAGELADPPVKEFGRDVEQIAA